LPSQRSDLAQLDLQRQLMRRTLLVTAHPDDEAIGAGILLQRLPAAALVCCTNGAPDTERFWREKGFHSREQYGEARRRELGEAAKRARLAFATMLDIKDQELYLHLPYAIDCVCERIREWQPESIVTHAYEGGHPDHDAASFVSSVAGARYSLPVWEMPLYHGPSVAKVRQRFRDDSAEIVEIAGSPIELERKWQLWAAHASQLPVLQRFDINLPELFRPQPRYDYTSPADGARRDFSSVEMPQEMVCAKFRELLRCA